MALRVALDTNRYTDLCRGDAELVQLLELAEQIFLPYVVLGELRAGFALGRHGRKNEQILNQFLLSENVGILWPNDQTTFHYAALFRQLRTQSTPIPTNDLWIAALVAQHSLALCDRDRHFDHLPQLLRV